MTTMLSEKNEEINQAEKKHARAINLAEYDVM